MLALSATRETPPTLCLPIPKPQAPAAPSEHLLPPKLTAWAKSTWSAFQGGATALKGLLVGTAQAAVLASLLSACATVGPPVSGPPLFAPSATAVECTIPAELRSWVVVGNGRHLRLDVDGGCGLKPFSVEFADASVSLDRSGVLGFGEVDTTRRIRPAGAGPIHERVEARYELTTSQAERVSHFRVYEHPYRLTGPNSSSALRAAMEASDIPIPPHIPGHGGVLSSFPGVDADPGRLVIDGPVERFGLFPLTDR